MKTIVIAILIVLLTVTVTLATDRETLKLQAQHLAGQIAALENSIDYLYRLKIQAQKQKQDIIKEYQSIKEPKEADPVTKPKAE